MFRGRLFSRAAPSDAAISALSCSIRAVALRQLLLLPPPRGRPASVTLPLRSRATPAVRPSPRCRAPSAFQYFSVSAFQELPRSQTAPAKHAKRRERSSLFALFACFAGDSFQELLFNQTTPIPFYRRPRRSRRLVVASTSERKVFARTSGLRFQVPAVSAFQRFSVSAFQELLRSPTTARQTRPTTRTLFPFRVPSRVSRATLLRNSYSTKQPPIPFYRRPRRSRRLVVASTSERKIFARTSGLRFQVSGSFSISAFQRFSFSGASPTPNPARQTRQTTRTIFHFSRPFACFAGNSFPRSPVQPNNPDPFLQKVTKITKTRSREHQRADRNDEQPASTDRDKRGSSLIANHQCRAPKFDLSRTRQGPHDRRKIRFKKSHEGIVGDVARGHNEQPTRTPS